MKRKAKIYYTSLDDFWRKEEKLEWLRDNPISKIEFERLEPDAKHNWINQSDNDFETLLPLIDKDVKSGKGEEAVFTIFTNGVMTDRDDWVYDTNQEQLIKKIKFFIEQYDKSILQKTIIETIKWSRDLKNRFNNKLTTQFKFEVISKAFYRPFMNVYFYGDKILNDVLTNNHFEMFGEKLELKTNRVITITGLASTADFSCFAVNQIVDRNFYHHVPQCLPLYLYKANNKDSNQKHENITDWALNQFQTHYETKAEARASARAQNDETQESTLADARVSASKNGARITKQDIFYYTYGVLHSPQYRRKYERNLKREFPRLPFYEDFTQWRDWGKELMDLHINYETREPFPLERKDLDSSAKRRIANDTMFDEIINEKIDGFVSKPRTKLRARKDEGVIEIDSITHLEGVPALAWEYKLGNRSALEWILDQYKEKKPSDATIAERFNTYKFEDYKEQVIDLLKRVCSVSVKTMEIVNRMPPE